MRDCRVRRFLYGGNHVQYTNSRFSSYRKKYREASEESRIISKGIAEYFWVGTPQALYKWQHGTALPTVDNLVLLSAIFKVSIDEILVVEQCGGIVLSASA